MSHENVEVVLASIEAYKAEDFDAQMDIRISKPRTPTSGAMYHI
jgi:hypothetical protein